MSTDSRKKAGISSLAAALVAVAGIAPTNAEAQQQSSFPSESVGLEEVVVTARRREENLMETPVSITAFTTAELEARQMDTISQISEATPGLVFRRTGTLSNSSATIFIRGVGQSSVNVSRQPGVAMYVDGVYIAQSQGSLIDLVDIESVEVLRGPQGTLFGRNSIGGAIQISTVKPHDEFDASVELLVGDYSRRRIKGSVNIPFNDTFFAQLSASYQEKDGFVDTPLIPDDNGLGGDDNSSVRAAFRWLPSDDVTVDFVAERSEHESDGPPTILHVPINETTAGAGFPPLSVGYNTIFAPALGLPQFRTADFVPAFVPGAGGYTSFRQLSDPSVIHPLLVDMPLGQQSEWTSTSLTMSWDVSDNLTFKSITNHRKLENNAVVDPDQSPTQVATGGEFYDGDQFSQEFQISGTAFDGRMDWVSGLYLFAEDVTHIQPIGFWAGQFVSGAISENASTALFGQFTYDLTDRLSLTAGLRYTEEKLDSITDDSIHYVNRFFDANVPGFFIDFPAKSEPGGFALVPNGVLESDAEETEPYLNLAYSITDNLLAYVSYSEGFKGGGYTQNIGPGGQQLTFAPEFAKVYEIGAKWQTDRLRLSGAWFFNDYTDLQVDLQRQFGVTVQNAADAEITGGEIELVAAFTDRFNVSLGVGFLDGKYTSLLDDPVLGTVQFDINNQLPNVADWTANASASYTYPLGELGHLVARLDYFRTEDYFTEADNLPELFWPSYDVFNGSVTFISASEKWEVAVQGRNITDEFYLTSGGGSNLGEGGYANANVGAPAEWAGRFTYRF